MKFMLKVMKHGKLLIDFDRLLDKPIIIYETDMLNLV